MSVWTIVGLCWLALSVVLAPLVGKCIAYRTRYECPECLEASMARHPVRHREHL